MGFSFRDRETELDELDSQIYDLVIVGGGITGAGMARDAASRGMKVALLEAQDFAIGTSSRSSKLIHGGIRYLENLEFKLVFEALSERTLLFEMAPHLVHPLRFILPIYENSRVGYWTMAAGMWLYDILSVFEAPEMHKAWRAENLMEEVPSLAENQLCGAFEYSDAYMDDDRLVIETLRSARQWDASMVSYCRVEKAEWSNNAIIGLHYRDLRGGRQGMVRGKQIVSAVGPWTDIFGEKISTSWKKRLRPTKGIHITFPRKRFPLGKAVVMAVETRIIFVIPRNEMVIVGTTDTDFSRDPSLVQVTAEDVSYLLKALKDYFPGLNLSEEDIIGSYAGVRPLIHDGSENEGKTSREHEIFSAGDNLSFVAGGKYTTYRKMAEDTVEFILKKMTFEERMSWGANRTKEPLNPLVTPDKLQRLRLRSSEYETQYRIPPEVISFFIERHGEEAIGLLEKLAFLSFEDPWQAVWMVEAEFAIEETCCLSLVDFYWRRTPLFLSYENHGREYCQEIAKVFQSHFKWSDIEKSQALTDLEETIQKELSWKKN